MPQVTLYLDEETKAKMERASKAAGLSQSKWLVELIRKKTSGEWPQGVAELAGAWKEQPTVEELRRDDVADLPREPL